MLDPLFCIVLLLILIVFSGYCSSSEVALFSLSSMQVKAFQSDANPRKRLIALLLSKPRDLLVTVFMLNTMVNILIQNVSSDLFRGNAGWLLKVGFPLVITLVFGEIIPKNIGLQNNVRLSYFYAPSINFFHKIISPLRRFILFVTTPISHLMFFYLKKAEDISKEELSHTLQTSEKLGVLHPDETELVLGYLNLQEANIKEVMRPKEDILFYNICEPLTKLSFLIVDQECSRLPVCDGSLEKLLGIISAKDFFLHNDTFKSGKDIIPQLTKPFYTPESIPVKILMRRFSETEETFSIVLDEYGSVAGVITEEDIAELVIGDIRDLRDQKKNYSQSRKDDIIAEGRLDLSEFNEIFGSELKSPSSRMTIGGWLIEKLGEIPKSGSEYKFNGFLFRVLSAEPNRIRKLYIRKTE